MPSKYPPANATIRAGRIRTALDKLLRKLELNPDGHRASDYRARVAEYERSLRLLVAQAQVEAIMKEGDVTVSPPTAGVSVRGQ